MKQKKTPLITIMLCLALMASWGLYKIASKPNKPVLQTSPIVQTTAPNQSVRIEEDRLSTSNNLHKTNTPASFSFAQELINISNLIDQGKFDNAVSEVDRLYRQLSNDELERLKQVFLVSAERLMLQSNPEQAFELLSRYTRSFDDMDAWHLLSQAAFILKKWPAAVNALLRSTAQEYRPDQLESKLDELVRLASHQRASLEAQGDEIGIRQLYKKLYQQHPNHARFQLELAQSHLRLGDIESAIPLLETLQYDLELGSLAKQKLATISAQISAQKEREEEPEQATKATNRSELVVPLLRSGNSFLVDVSMNSKPLRMLLDTGASITALSTSAIKQLKLKPTGRYIKLTTANGVRRSQLYQARNIKIGRLTMNNMIVAEIEMEQSNQFKGLLGTDLLNQVDSNYTYLIDNQRNALIFKAK